MNFLDKIFKKKLSYTAPSTDSISIEPQGILLRGSVVDTKIQINSVSVEEFQDGFADEGGFKDISFD